MSPFGQVALARRIPHPRAGTALLALTTALRQLSKSIASSTRLSTRSLLLTLTRQRSVWSLSPSDTSLGRAERTRDACEPYSSLHMVASTGSSAQISINSVMPESRTRSLGSLSSMAVSWVCASDRNLRLSDISTANAWTASALCQARTVSARSPDFPNSTQKTSSCQLRVLISFVARIAVLDSIEVIRFQAPLQVPGPCFCGIRVENREHRWA